MKKSILTLTSVLLFIYIILSVISRGDGYHAERQLWRIDKQLSFIASHLESTPEFTINQVASRYQNFIKEYSKTIYGKKAELMLGDLYALKKNYPQARIEYQNAICSDKEISAQAEFTIAKTYELENNWSEALRLYKNIIQNYPLTMVGFYVPMYLVNHKVSPEDQEFYTQSAYTDALSFYKKIAAKSTRSKLNYNALKLSAICELNLKDWNSAVSTMSEIILKYPFGKVMDESVNAINLLCITKLHNYDLAINIYKQFIEKHPNNLGNPILKKMIKDLQLLKSKKLIIQSKTANPSK